MLPLLPLLPLLLTPLRCQAPLLPPLPRCWAPPTGRLTRCLRRRCCPRRCFPPARVPCPPLPPPPPPPRAERRRLPPGNRARHPPNPSHLSRRLPASLHAYGTAPPPQSRPSPRRRGARAGCPSTRGASRKCAAGCAPRALRSTPPHSTPTTSMAAQCALKVPRLVAARPVTRRSRGLSCLVRPSASEERPLAARMPKTGYNGATAPAKVADATGCWTLTTQASLSRS